MFVSESNTPQASAQDSPWKWNVVHEVVWERLKSAGRVDLLLADPSLLCTLHAPRESRLTLDLLLATRQARLRKALPRLAGLCDTPGWIDWFAGNGRLAI